MASARPTQLAGLTRILDSLANMLSSACDANRRCRARALPMPAHRNRRRPKARGWFGGRSHRAESKHLGRRPPSNAQSKGVGMSSRGARDHESAMRSDAMTLVVDTRKLKRDAIKALLRPWLRWRPLDQPRDGFSIVLGVPWALRHLLPLNLQFVGRTDLGPLHRMHVVFDRVRQEGSEAFTASVAERFPRLPLSFGFHPPLIGHLVELVNQSKFYASMNWTLGLAQCETRYAVLHDFDLYPLV